MTAQCGAKQGKSLPANGTGEVGLFQYVFELYLYAVRIPQKNFHSDMFPRAAFLGSSVSATQHVAQLHFGTFRVQEVPNPDLHGISWGYRYAWYSLRSSRPRIHTHPTGALHELHSKGGMTASCSSGPISLGAFRFSKLQEKSKKFAIAGVCITPLAPCLRDIVTSLEILYLS